MASTSKFDLSSSSLDRSLYSSGQRGSHITTSMDNSMSSLFPSSRNGSYATQNDVANFFQCLPTESDNCSGYLDIFGLTEQEKNNERDVHQWQKIGTHDQEAVPLWQRPIAALIPEEEVEYCETEHNDFMTNGQESRFEPDQQVDPNVSFHDSGTIHWHSDSFSSEDCLMSNIPGQQGRGDDVTGTREM